MESVGKAVRMVAFSSEVIGSHQKSSEVIRAWWEVRNFVVAGGALGEGNVLFPWQLGWGSGEKVGGSVKKWRKNLVGKVEKV